MGDLFSHVSMYICMYVWVTLYKCCGQAWECHGLCLIGADGARRRTVQSLCWAAQILCMAMRACCPAPCMNRVNDNMMGRGIMCMRTPSIHIHIHTFTVPVKKKCTTSFLPYSTRLRDKEREREKERHYIATI